MPVEFFQSLNWPELFRLAVKEYAGEQFTVFPLASWPGHQYLIDLNSTVRGDACGGVRFYQPNHPNAFYEAGAVTIHLAMDMTLKNALAGLDLGGAKSFLLGSPDELKNPAFEEKVFREVGRCVNTFGGKYYAAEDAGTTVRHMEFISKETKYVLGKPQSMGGTGDPSNCTAKCALEAGRPAIGRKFGVDSYRDLRMSIQGGGGAVSGFAIRYLLEEGVPESNITISEIHVGRLRAVLEKYSGLRVVSDEEFWRTKTDVMILSALHWVLNPETIPMINCGVVIPITNIPFPLGMEVSCARAIQDKSIICLPAFACNSGGIRKVELERQGQKFTEKWMEITAQEVRALNGRILKKAEEKNLTPYEIAVEWAKEQIESAKPVR